MSKKKNAAPVEIEADYDTPEGVRAALAAAKKGDTDARETLARRLSWIIGGDIPYTESEVEELIAAAEAGWNSILSHPDCHPDDMYQYAVDILWDDEGNVIGENASDGAAWMLRAAENDHADAQLEAGRFYYEGIGVRQSLEIAAEWFRKAAKDDLNAEHAEYFLGEIKKKSRAPFAKTTKPAAKKSVAKKVAVKKSAPAKKSAKTPAAKAKKPAAKPTAKAPVKKSVAKAKPAKKSAKPVAKAKPAKKAAVKKPAAKKKPATKRK